MTNDHPTSAPSAGRMRESEHLIKVRPVRDDDVEALVALWEACGLTRPWNDPVKDIAFARAGAASGVLAAFDGAQMVASVMVGHDGHRGAVYYVSVHPSRQGEGLGRLIMSAAEDWLRERGVWKLNLLVRTGNDKAAGFYEEIGYRRSEVFSMQKDLDKK